jgi:putative ABC transport system permease protein
MWKILLEEFIGDLRKQKLRATLTMLAMTWGTVAVVLLLSFGEGLKVAIVRGLVNAGDQIFMVYGGQTSRVFEGLPTGRSIRLTEEDLDLVLQSIPEFEMGSPSYGRWGTSLRAGDQQTNTYMEGVAPEFSELRRMFPAAGGRFLNQQDMEQRRRVLFLGNRIAGRLFPESDPVGQSVMLDGLPFTVIGVMQRKFQDSSNNGPDENRAIIPASTFRTIYGRRYVGHLIVRPRSVEEAERAKAALYRVLGRKYKFDPEDIRALQMWDFVEDAKLVNQIGIGIQVFLGLVGAFTLLIAGVGVANIMYVVVREAMLIAFVGGGLGLLFSGLVVAATNAIPSDNEAMAYIANPILSWPIALICVSILVMIGLAAGVLPARRAANVDPVESLRYE